MLGEGPDRKNDGQKGETRIHSLFLANVIFILSRLSSQDLSH